jgi:hypothetical protein
MKTSLSLLVTLSLLSALVHAAEPNYTPVEGWLKPSAEMATIGAAHGDVAVSSTGDVYVNLLPNSPRSGIQVFAADGSYLRNLPDAPDDFHGFIIHKEPDGEFIYGARLQGQSILKMPLDGTVVMTIDGSVIPDAFDRDGDIFVTEFNMYGRVLRWDLQASRQ